MSRIINLEQLQENWKHQLELMDWLYPDRPTDIERKRIIQEYERRRHGNKSLSNRDQGDV